MTHDEQTLLLIRGQIASLPEDDQIKIKAIAATLRNILSEAGCATLAFALVGAEMATEP